MQQVPAENHGCLVYVLLVFRGMAGLSAYRTAHITLLYQLLLLYAVFLYIRVLQWRLETAE